MVIIQARSRRKPSGGLNRATRSKRTHMHGRPAALPKIGTTARKRRVPTKGGNSKQRLYETDVAYIYNPKTKKHEKATMKAVADNPANRNFIRRNILTQGTIVETNKGNARITNRPGQDGTVHAVLME